MLLPVVMAGGVGSRLWPLSRALYPKQFIALASEDSLLQDTINRLSGLSHMPPLLICNDEHRFIVAEQLRQKNIKHGGIVLEPVGRNTAPAIALAALRAMNNGDDPLLLVLAADHVIQNEESFRLSVEKAVPYAESGKLVTFGIVPTSPETGYGYIRQGDSAGDEAFHVAEFVEKPDYNIAQGYCESGEYYWNSGMFLFKASKYIDELKKFSLDIFNFCEDAINHSEIDLDFIRVDEEAFFKCPSDSVDYAVMEKTDDAILVTMDANWSDVGSFKALWEIADKDNDNNATFGDVIIDTTSNSYIRSHSRLVTTVGIDNLVIVETKDAVLVADKTKVQNVKSIVNNLKENKRSEYLQHREAYRPWGTHDEIAKGDRYHVKHLKIKPGESTALQVHYHRAEHWVVVQGTAEVQNGNDLFVVSENESTYIPIGSQHRILNPGKIDLHLIEVRSGSYLEENDITRIKEYEVKS